MLTYVLSDHLGSTSLVTDASGQVISETKYKAWGEVRQATGTSPINYTYTGQYSYTADFGLMYYNARWYDPALGRFAQADTIVPGGVQGLDRYAYVNNSPMNFVDPSGHCAMDDSMDDCYSSDNIERANSLVKMAKNNPGKRAYGRYALESIANLYGINISPSDHWEYESSMIRGFGTGTGILGTTPRTEDEIYFGYNPENPVASARYTANDSGVYITGVGFDYCQNKLSCIATLMVHEAVHSWVEYLIGGSNPETITQDPALESEFKNNEELFADNTGRAIFPTGKMDFDSHTSSINNSCVKSNHNCSSPQAYLEGILSVDLSNVGSLVLR